MGDVDLAHVDSGYAGDVVAGYRMAVLLTVLGGLPLAFVAFAVPLATWRRARRPWPMPAAAVFPVAFVIECASCLCCALFLALVVAEAPSAAAFFGEPLILLLLATLAGSAAALPAWRTAMLATGPDRPPSVVTGRRD